MELKCSLENRMLRKLALLPCFIGTVWSCATVPRPSQLKPADVAGCYLVSVLGDAEVTGVFPDTIGLDSLPSIDTTDAYAVGFTVGQAQRVQLLAWRMIGADSFEVFGRVSFKTVDLRARLKSDGFEGIAAFTDMSHTTTGMVRASRGYCVGFGAPPSPKEVEFAKRSDSLGALVDTIVVLSPDSIVLRVGQSVQTESVIRTEGRRNTGEVLQTYPWMMSVEDQSIAEAGEAGLLGLRVGHTRLMLTVMGMRAHAPPSYISIIVIP